MQSRTAGVVLPLFSLRTRRDWGIGQISDLPAAAAWVRSAGHRLLQILPPHELSRGETSPYGALTAFGIDPIYIDIDAIADLDVDAIDQVLGDEGRRERERVRSAERVDYATVRALKTRALRAAFERFCAREWSRGTPRASELAAFIASERAWLDDLALYAALRGSHAEHGWETWPGEERDRSPAALDRVRRDQSSRLLEVAYVQWIALRQWFDARAKTREHGVELMGDLPFVVCSESADVWSRASQFQRGMSLGAPPDGFSPDGQDWGLPPYDWRAMDGDDLAWLRARTRHAARLYDRFRLDHVVGYFRQWLKTRGEPAHVHGHFEPADEGAQIDRGRRVLGAMKESCDGSRIIAEDLGVIPPFVRDTMSAMTLPGYKVIPWERDEHHRLRDPAAFPEVSVATFSTHDTMPITSWWDEFSADDRADLARLAGFDHGASPEDRSIALLGWLFRSRSELTLALVQELLGERTRINTPGTVGAQNWTYRLPRPIEDLAADAALIDRFAAVRRLVEGAGR